MSRYTVVRLAPPTPRGLESGLESAMDMDMGSDVSVHVAELERGEAERLRGDQQGNLVIPTMPLTLVRPDPLANDDALSDTAEEGHTWGLAAVGAAESKYDGRGVRVAMLDSGIDLDHVAFARLRDEERIIWRNFCSRPGDRADFTSGAEHDVSDSSGHGTHCAGTICGDPVDGVRIGIAPRLDRLIVGKVLGPGGGNSDVVVKALLWAVEQRADIVSMSLGLDFPGWVESLIEEQGLGAAEATSMALEDYRDTLDAYRELTDFLRLRGLLVVAATGNESDRPRYTINVAPPAAADRIISVGALERRPAGLRVAKFSNTRPDIAAPGVNIRSAKLGGGLTSKNGTSMAAPHVAGVAALWCQKLRDERGAVAHELLVSKLLGMATLDPLEKDFRATRDVGAGLVRAP